MFKRQRSLFATIVLHETLNIANFLEWMEELCPPCPHLPLFGLSNVQPFKFQQFTHLEKHE